MSYDGLGAGKKILFRCINKIIKIKFFLINLIPIPYPHYQSQYSFLIYQFFRKQFKAYYKGIQYLRVDYPTSAYSYHSLGLT